MDFIKSQFATLKVYKNYKNCFVYYYLAHFSFLYFLKHSLRKCVEIMNSSCLGPDVVKIIYLVKSALWAGLIDKPWSPSWRTAFTRIKPIAGLACVCVWERERGWLWDFERRLIECGIWTSWRVSKMGWVCLNFVGFRFELGSKCFKFKHNFSKRKFITKQTPTTRKGTTQSSK